MMWNKSLNYEINKTECYVQSALNVLNALRAIFNDLMTIPLFLHAMPAQAAFNVACPTCGIQLPVTFSF